MMIKRLHNPVAVVAALVVLALVFAIAGAVNSNSATLGEKTDRFAIASQELCEHQTWPDVSAACLSWETGASARKSFVRMITIERRDEAHQLSILTRVPVTQTANR